MHNSAEKDVQLYINLYVTSVDYSNHNDFLSGRAGRPKVHISVELYELMKEASYSLTQIAEAFVTSRTTLWRRLKENNISHQKYSVISDHVLNYLIGNYQKRNPNCGEAMLQGYMSSIGLNVQRWRIRASIRRC